MIALLTSTDHIKLSAVRSILAGEGIDSELFDTASGALFQSLIPVRLMVMEDDRVAARRILRQAGFVEAADGDWDLAPVG
jgi:ribosomal protein S18 acetylase RimI-like enzyme